jgi:hypothetical protein
VSSKAVIGNLKQVRSAVRKAQTSGALDRGNINWRVGSFADRALGRVRPGNVVVVGGRTNSGKSLFSLALQVDNLGRSAYISLEDDEVEIARRVECVADEDAERITLAIPSQYTSGEVMKVVAEVAKLDSWDLYEECKLVVLDYVQLLAYSGTLPALSRTESMAHIIADLRRHGKDHGYALALNAQITRPPKPSAPGKRRIDAEDEEDTVVEHAPPRPTLFDLKDSSSIENAATYVLLVHGRAHWCDVTVAKNKSGPIGFRQRYARTENGWLEPI